MAKTLIGNVKGKDGRGIASIDKTGTTGSVDTYTITYTDGTSSTYTVNNSDGISLQRQIVPSAAVESSTTASQSYTAGDYVVVNGVLRKVTGAIAKGNIIGDSNSTATTVGGELATLGDSVSALEDSVSSRKVACGSFVLNKGSNYFWDMMSFEDAAKNLGCSVSDFHIASTGVENLFCFICSGDATNSTGPAIAEFDVSRQQIRLRFTTADAYTFRANWVLILI